ncbi:MAG TPA: TonB-dependent receptor [Campylobacterales bacterium]|nr:TonB-dependent receptor [Campylobacterales bacterium]
MKQILTLSALAAMLFGETDELSKALEAATKTAVKTRANADYMPGTVSIIKGEELKALGIQNLNQPNALDMITGMESLGGSMRGSGSVYGAHGNKIKWLLNGNTLSSQAKSGPSSLGVISSFPVSVDQIDRIEIIRGPDSAIYGDNAIFGVINIITKKSNNDISVSLSSQNKDKRGASATSNLAYKKEELELSASTSVYQSDGYPFYISEQGAFANFSTGGHMPGYAPGYLPNASLGYSVLLDAKYNSFSAWLTRLDTKSAQSAFGNWYPSDIGPKDDNRLLRSEAFTQFGVKNDFNIGGAVVTPKVGIDIYDNKLRDFFKVGSMYTTTPQNGIDGVRNARYKEERRHAAIDVGYKMGAHYLSGGILTQTTKNLKDEVYRNYAIASPWIPFATSGVWDIVNNQYVGGVITAQNTHRDQSAFYFQDRWDMSDKTTITAGARYDKFCGDIKSVGWSPRVAVVYRADREHILKAQYARAFRLPLFTENDGMGGSIKSETVDTLELGHIYKKDRIELKTTIFESRIYNMITFNDLTYDTENLPKRGVLQGVEIEFKYEGDNFRAGFNQALYKTRADAREYVSQYSPKQYLFEAGAFVLSPSAITNLFLTLNQKSSYPTTLWYHYIGGKKRKTAYATDDAYYNGSPNGYVDPQDYLNITQQFKNVAKNLDLSLGVQNVFGKTLKTLYMPLNQPNTQDIPYMKQMFWVNMSYKF